MKQWYCAISGQRYGPISEQDLRQWIREGRVSAGDLVWSDGMAEWAPAGQMFADEFDRGAGAAQPLRGLATALPPGGTGGRATIGQLKEEALSCLSGRWGLAVGFCVLSWLIHVGIGMACGIIKLASPPVGTTVQYIVQLILEGPLNLGLVVFFLAYARRGPAEIGMLFIGFRHFGCALAVHLLTTLFVLGWFLLFASVGIVLLIVGVASGSQPAIILGAALFLPGIVAAIVAGLSYSQAFYVVADDLQIGPVDAIRRSRDLMRGNKGNFFVLGLSFIGWVLLCLLTLGIGLLWLAPYMGCTFGRFYDDLQPPAGYAAQQAAGPNPYAGTTPA